MTILIIHHAKSKKLDELARPPVWLNFADFMHMLLESLYRFNPFEDVIIGLANGDQKLKREFSQYSNRISFRDFTYVGDGPEIWAQIRASEFKLLEECLNISPGPYILIDNDVLFRGSLNNLYQNMATHHVGFYFDHNELDRSKFNVGVLAVRGLKSLKFIQEWRLRVLEDPNQHEWFIKQRHAYSLFCEWQNRLNFLDITTKYNDGDLKTESTIWHAYKKSKLDKFQQFQQEINSQRQSHIPFL